MDQSCNHSEKIKKLWKEGKYNNRDESYRNDPLYKEKISKTVKERWKDGTYKNERNKKISESHKGKPKPWLQKQKVYFRKLCENCRKKFITEFKTRRFCNKTCSSFGVKRKISSKVEKKRREKISRKLKNKIPKNIESLHGENHWNWKGGISCEPYCEIWLDNDFKESIKERDKYKCLNPECSKNNMVLCIHHIDYVKKNCHPYNLITLCVSCNAKANKDRVWHKFWYQAIIYRRYILNSIENEN